MKQAFPFIEIPDSLKKNIGKPIPDTRLYRAVGTREDMIKWISVINEICGKEGHVSPGGVAAMVGVSRAAVHKRMKEGRLTAFNFYLVKEVKILFKFKTLDEWGQRPNICVIPASESIAWGSELTKRRKVKNIQEEDYITRKDWDDDFLSAPKDWRKTFNP
jgi:hypothetical protein